MALTKISTGMLKQDAASSDLNIDAGTLYIDVSNNRVGVNNTSPSFNLDVSGTGQFTGNLEVDSTILTRQKLQISNGRLFELTGTSTAFTIRDGSAATDRLTILAGGNVGVGITNPSWDFVVSNGGAGGIEFGPDGITAGTSFIQAYNRTSSSYDKLRYYASEHQFYIGGSTHALNINSSGYIGIGTDSPARALHIVSTGEITRFESTNATSTITLKDNLASNEIKSVNGKLTIGADTAGNISNSRIGFAVDNTERMRIDDSGNLLISGTTSSIDAGSISLEAQGRIRAGRDGGAVMQLNRTTSDGDIIVFYKDASSVGSIGSNSARFYIHNNYGSGSGLRFDNAEIRPSDSSGNGEDATTDLGASAARFKDLYLSGTANTGGLTSVGDAAITGSSSGSTVLTLTSNALVDTPLMVFQRIGGAVAGKLAYEDNNTAISFGTTTAHELKFLTSNTERMQIDSSGNVGIGTASPGFKLEIADDTDGAVDLLRFRNSDNTYSQTFDFSLDTGKNLSITGASSSGGIILKPGSYGTEIRRDAGGALGAKLTLRNYSNTAGSYVRLQLAPTQAGVDDRNVTIQGENIDGNNNMAMVFKTSAGASPAEAMRIDQNGNLLVGKQSANFTVDGHEIRQSSYAGFTRNSGSPVVVNRRTDSGDMIEFYKDTTPIGTIGSIGGANLFINSKGSGGYGRLQDNGSDIAIWWSNGFYPGADSVKDLGVNTTSGRWRNLFLAGTAYAGAANISSSVAGDYVASFENTNSTNGYGIKAVTAHTGTSAFAFGAYGGSNALMVVRGDGNVGIGTTSPSYLLHVNGGNQFNSGWIRANTGTAANPNFTIDGGAGMFKPTSNVIGFSTDSTERLRIASGNPYMFLGNTGHSWGTFHAVAQIGRTGAVATYDSGANQQTIVANNTYYGSGGYTSIEGTSAASYMNVNQGHISFFTAPTIAAGSVQTFTQRFQIHRDGNIGIGTAAPTYRLHMYRNDGSDTVFAIQNDAATRLSELTFLDENDAKTVRFYYDNGSNRAYQHVNGNGLTIYSSQTTSEIARFGLAGSGYNASYFAGNVGIGDTSPSSKLSVGNGSASTFVTINNPSSGDISSGYNINWGSTTGTSLYSNPADNTTTLLSNGDINFRANNGNRLIIKAGGQVGIGISNPQTNGIFSVSCNLSAAFMGHFSNVNGSGYGLGLNTSSGNAVFFYHSFSNVGSITTTSTYTSYATTSDVRLKENIVDAPSASEDIDAIQVRSFDWKADGSHQKYGMVAQELAEVLPSAVNVPEEENRMQSVDYSKLVPMLVKEVQSLRARVAELEGEK